jgi:hypothetical protein
MRQNHLLDVYLERYSITARTVLNLKPPLGLGELTLYRPLAAGSALALAPGADYLQRDSGHYYLPSHQLQRHYRGRPQ